MKKNKEISITVQVDPAGLIPLLEMIRDDQSKALSNTEQMIANLRTDKRVPAEPEIRIIEQGAIPAAYYYRPAVVEAIRQEIIKDHKAGQPIPPGVELINQEEDAQNGKTEKISDPENDSTIGGDGSEPSPDGSNDGSQNSGGGSSDPGGESKDSPETGTSRETPGEK